MFPDFHCEELPPQHEVFSIYFKMKDFPPQARLRDNTWLNGPTNPLRLLYVGDRVIGILSLSGMQCAWAVRAQDHAPMMMVTNIYLYAITR